MLVGANLNPFPLILNFNKREVKKMKAQSLAIGQSSYIYYYHHFYSDGYH